MKIKTKRQSKGLIFAGCSFTWGQGLYYYSNLPSIQDAQENRWEPRVVTHSQIDYMKSVRFPRLVANYFNTFEICQNYNGGANHAAVEYWEKTFNDDMSTKYCHYHGQQTYFFKDFEFIIFQLTQWGRGASFFTDNEPHYYDLDKGDFEQILNNHNLTYDKWVEKAIQTDLEKVKNLLFKFENNGVKSLILTWPIEWIPYIKQDPFLQHRFINFNYDDKVFDSIESLISYDRKLKISTDTDFFIDPPLDHHPSLRCHRLIADNIINFIEKNYERT